MILRIAGTKMCDIANGPGIRFVVFTQGCKHNCPGCHNPSTHDPKGGYTVDTADLAKEITVRIENGFETGVTLSGGDPFEQQEACVDLLKRLPGVNIWIYTGYLYSQIKDTELAKMADTIVDGPYMQDRRVLNEFRGSANQCFIYPKKEKMK